MDGQVLTPGVLHNRTSANKQATARQDIGGHHQIQLALLHAGCGSNVTPDLKSISTCGQSYGNFLTQASATEYSYGTQCNAQTRLLRFIAGLQCLADLRSTWFASCNRISPCGVKRSGGSYAQRAGSQGVVPDR